MSRTPKTRTNSPIAYYRVSTDKQGKSGLGLDAQRAAVERYLQGQAPIAEYVEIESGKRNDRPQLAAALGHSKRIGGVLIIAKLDRLARNVAFISRLMEEATNFVVVDMPHANRLTIHIIAAMAEHEREMISARTKAALEQVKARGTKLGNPRWRESIAKACAARWPGRNQDTVQELIRDRHARGESLRTIAAALNELGLKTRTGAIWHASSVRQVLLEKQNPEA